MYQLPALLLGYGCGCFLTAELVALRRTGGNMRAAAALLGVSRGGLYLKTKRLGIDAGRWRK